ARPARRSRSLGLRLRARAFAPPRTSRRPRAKSPASPADADARPRRNLFGRRSDYLSEETGRRRLPPRTSPAAARGRRAAPRVVRKSLTVLRKRVLFAKASRLPRLLTRRRAWACRVAVIFF